ncbi:MAG: ABC transporter substrate-binding protein, partial [Dehalococcoidales bacterium]
MKRLSFLLLGVILIVALLMTSCAKPLETIKIGVLLPFSGPLSEFGGAFQKAADLAAKHLDEAGVPVELIYADTQTSAIPAVEAARKLVDIDQVVAVVGAAASGVTVPVAESVTIPRQVPQISYASTSPLITILPADQGKNFVYRTGPSDALQGVVLGRLAADQGYKTVSTIFVNNPYGQGLNDVFKAAFEAQGGRVLAEVPHDEKAAPTYVAELKKAAEGD